MLSITELKKLFDEMPKEKAQLQFFNKKTERWADTDKLYAQAYYGKERFRWKPMPQEVSLVLFANTGIDCEFWNEGDEEALITELTGLYKDVDGQVSYTNRLAWYSRCQPRLDRWTCINDVNVINDSEEQQVMDDVICLIKDAGFECMITKDQKFFKITGMQEDLTYPWD